jgi:hypothetical protein
MVYPPGISDCSGKTRAPGGLQAFVIPCAFYGMRMHAVVPTRCGSTWCNPHNTVKTQFSCNPAKSCGRFVYARRIHRCTCSSGGPTSRTAGTPNE